MDKWTESTLVHLENAGFVQQLFVNQVKMGTGEKILGSTLSFTAVCVVCKKVIC